PSSVNQTRAAPGEQRLGPRIAATPTAANDDRPVATELRSIISFAAQYCAALFSCMETPRDPTASRYEHAAKGLRRSDLHRDPIKQFGNWFTAAIEAGIRDVNAMSLATAGADGRPSVRIVLLKGFDRDGFVFFTNYESEKGKQLDANPYAALAF